MKRAHKLLLGSALLLAALVCLWCVLCPVLFPQRVKAANDKYQTWIAVSPPAARVKKLGEIQLMAQTPKRVALGDGKDLVITTTVMPGGEIQLNLEVQPTPTDVSMHPFEQGPVLMRFVRSGKEYDLPLGDGLLRFTPIVEKP